MCQENVPTQINNIFCKTKCARVILCHVKVVPDGHERPFSSVLSFDQSNYYAQNYLKESICPMSIKFRTKYAIGVLINLPKYFASHFCGRGRGVRVGDER